MGYVATLEITSATSEGLIVATQASVPTASAATVTVLAGGAASDCVVSTGGSLRTWAADGTGVLDTVTVYDGTLFVRSSGNVGSNLTFSGGIGYLQNDATMTDVNIYGGTLSAYTGTLENATVYGGNLYAIYASTGMVFSNTTVYGGTFIVRKLNNSATGVFLSGGLTYLQEGAAMSDVHVSSGATFYNIEGTLDGLTIYTGGQLLPNNNFKNSNVVINNLDVRAGGVATINGTAVINGAKLAGNDNAVNISGDVTINNLSQTAGWTRVSSGVTISGANITGGALWLRDSGVYANDVFINNGSLYVDYEGTSATNVMIAGGQVNLRNDARISAATVTGGMLIGYNGVAEDILINGGGMQAVYSTGQVLISNTTMRAGTLIVRSAGNSAVDLKLSGGLTYLQEGASMTDVDIYNGGTFYAIKGTLDSATVYAGGKIMLPGGWSPDAVTFKNMDVRAGGSWTLYNNFALAGNITIESGANINGNGTFQTDVYAENNTIHNLVLGVSGSISSGITLSDFTLTAGRTMVSGGAVVTDALINGGELLLWDAAGGGLASGVTLSGGSIIARNAGNTVEDLTMLAGAAYVQGGGTFANVEISGGILQGVAGTIENVRIYGGGLECTWPADDLLVSNATVYGGSMIVRSAGRSAVDVTVSGGKVYLQTGAYGSSITVSSGGMLYMWEQSEAEAITILDNGYGQFTDVTLRNLVVDAPNTGSTGMDRAYLIGANVSGGRLNGRDGITLVYMTSGAQFSDVAVSGGSIFLAGNASMTDIEQTGGAVILRGSDAYVSGATIYSGGALYAQNGAVAEKIVVNGGTLLGYDTTFTNPAGSAETVRDVDVLAGSVFVGSGAAFYDLRVSAGSMTVRGLAPTIVGATVSAGVEVNVNYSSGGGDTALFDSLENVAGTLYLYGMEVGSSYLLGETAGTDETVFCPWGLYDNPVAIGGSAENPFTGIYDFSDGMTVNLSELEVDTPATAAPLTSATATVLENGDLAAKWDANTAYTSGVTIADATLASDVWVEIDGATVTAAPLYGATGNYAHTVNLYAKSGTIKSLAAGAEKNGSVAGVKLTADGADFTGAIYAGGFGSVTGATETLIAGGTFAKEVYAGALANYAKTESESDIGDVNFTVTGGEFSGNIYGASAVKMGTRGDAVAHTAGNVDITLAGGEAENGKFCLFAGGYATGSVFSETAAYTVEDVTVDITDGYWGQSNNGRGIFGGIFASGVLARIVADEEEDIDVTINVSGGEMGNIYGGGWAQQGGMSEVMGAVNITVTGGTVADIYGSGSHSISGGSTSVGSVNISVSGGEITEAIYARGLFAGDLVTGDALVSFSGTQDFSCGVYGYDNGGGAAATAAILSFAGFTGSFAGAVGGFDSIEFNDGTAMTLTTEATDVDNTAWKFDVSARAEALAGTAMLDWENADFADDVIALNLASGSTTEWALIDAARTAYDQFEVLVDGVSQGTLGLGDQLADGEFAGWGFAVEDTTLKFKNLA